MATIKDIMQIGVGIPDRETFARFSHDILGFPTANSPDGTVTYMRVDRYQHRLAARTAPEPRLNYIAFDVGDREALSEWKITLAGKNIDWRPGSTGPTGATVSTRHSPTMISIGWGPGLKGMAQVLRRLAGGRSSTRTTTSETSG